jgi:peroxiredoxin
MSKKSLKYVSFLYFLIFCITAFISEIKANDGLTVGETIPNPEFKVLNSWEILYGNQGTNIQRLYEYKGEDNLLIAFMPDITDKNNYAKVMTSAFDAYFAEGLAFRSYESYYLSGQQLKILIVTNNDEETVKEFMKNREVDFDMAAESNMNFENFFGINKWNSESDASHVYIINGENKIIYASHDYKGEGEKLKTVQKELYSIMGITPENPTSITEYMPLIEGDNARDFDFEYVYTGPQPIIPKDVETGKLSDYYGKKSVLIAFYPAAFSYSCGAEVTRFDTFAEEQLLERVANSQMRNENDFEILMISQSTQQILSKWADEMMLKNVKLVNDNTGDISMKYSSYSSLGYNKRTIFLIDKSGKVSYIDWDYKVDDEDFGLLKEHLISMN